METSESIKVSVSSVRERKRRQREIMLALALLLIVVVLTGVELKYFGEISSLASWRCSTST